MSNESMIGKKLIHKDMPASNPLQIVNQQGGWVELDDKSFVQQEKIKELFVEYNKDKAPDPDMFLNTENNSTMANLAQQYQQLRQQGGGRTTISTPSIDGDMQDGPPVEQVMDSRELSREEAMQMNLSVPAMPSQKTAAQLQAEQDKEWAREQGMVVEDDGGLVTEINTDDWKQPGAYVPGSMVAVPSNPQFGVPNAQQAHAQQAPAAKSPQQVMFEGMKRPYKVKFKLEVEEMIPKLESIRHFEDMFTFSIVETIAKEITERYLRNPKSLEALIQHQLEAIISPPKKKAVKKKVEEQPVAKPRRAAKPKTEE